MYTLTIDHNYYYCITVSLSLYRDPPEPTGDEPEDFEFIAPKIYEPVSLCIQTLSTLATNIDVYVQCYYIHVTLCPWANN